MATERPRRERLQKLRLESREPERSGEIQICVGPESSHALSEHVRMMRAEYPESVDYFAKNHEEGQLAAWQDTYVMSNLDTRDKESSGFGRCLGLVAVGKDKVSGQNVAILTHQSPPCFYKLEDASIYDMYRERREKFAEDLTQLLAEFMQRVDKESADLVVFGGAEGDLHPGDYRDHLHALSSLAHNLTGLRVRVADIPNRPYVELDESSYDPKRDVEMTDVYFDTRQRRLYVGKYSRIISKFPYDD